MHDLKTLKPKNIIRVSFKVLQKCLMVQTGVLIKTDVHLFYQTCVRLKMAAFLSGKSNIFKLNQTLTLFFSNFQLSSWARICSTTDMASRPCLTYSFSWKESEKRKEKSIRHDQVRIKTPQTDAATCAVTALRPRPSSSRSSSEPADTSSEPKVNLWL